MKISIRISVIPGYKEAADGWGPDTAVKRLSVAASKLMGVDPIRASGYAAA